MGGSDYDTPASSNSRIADDQRTWLYACDVDVTNWTKTNKFIVSLIAVAMGHSGGAQVTMKVQWQRDSQGTWYDLSNTGELDWIAPTVLSNCTSPILVGDRSGCNGGLTHGDSHEIEGAGSCTIGAIAQDEFIEIQVAINPANALDGEKYSFRLYDVTEGAALDEILAEITMATGVTEYSIDKSANFRVKGEEQKDVTADWRVMDQVSIDKLADWTVKGEEERNVLADWRVKGEEQIDKTADWRVAAQYSIDKLANWRVKGEKTIDKLADWTVKGEEQKDVFADWRVEGEEQIDVPANFRVKGEESVDKLADWRVKGEKAIDKTADWRVSDGVAAEGKTQTDWLEVIGGS